MTDDAALAELRHLLIGRDLSPAARTLLGELVDHHGRHLAAPLIVHRLDNGLWRLGRATGYVDLPPVDVPVLLPLLHRVVLRYPRGVAIDATPSNFANKRARLADWLGALAGLPPRTAAHLEAVALALHQRDGFVFLKRDRLPPIDAA